MDNSSFSWAGTKDALRARLGSEVVSRWLEPLAVASVSDEAITLEAPNPFFRDWVATHYAEAISSHVGPRNLRIVTSAATSLASVLPSVVAPIRTVEPGVVPPAPVETAGWDQGLSVKLTFDRFVVGPSNRFAHAASLAVAESPAKAYNPLFIYGGVGLGKTHLMQAIGHAIRQRWSARRIVYISSERFTNELIASA